MSRKLRSNKDAIKSPLDGTESDVSVQDTPSPGHRPARPNSLTPTPSPRIRARMQKIQIIIMTKNLKRKEKTKEVKTVKTLRNEENRKAIIQNIMVILRRDGVILLNVEKTIKELLGIDKTEAKNEVKKIKNYVRDHVTQLEQLDGFEKIALTHMIGVPVNEKLLVEYGQFISVDEKGFLEEMCFPGEKKVVVMYNQHLHMRKKARKKKVEERIMYSLRSSKSIGSTKNEDDTSSRKEDKNGKENSQKESTHSNYSDTSDDDLSSPSSRPSRPPPLSPSPDPSMESTQSTSEEQNKKSSKLGRNVQRKGGIVEKQRQNPMPPRKNTAGSPNIRNRNHQSECEQRTGTNVPKQRERRSISESGHSDIQKDRKDLTAISFFQSHQHDHLKRYIVIQEIYNFYNHMIKEEHSSLASILGKLMDDVGKDISTERFGQVLDHLLIEVSTLHGKAVTIRWEKTIEFERILYAFNGLVASLKYEMKADTKGMWEALKEKNIKNPKYISVAEVNDSMAIHLARV